MKKSTLSFALPAFALALGMYVVPPASTQETAASGKTTVTGCLQKGDEAGEFSITGQDGKTYGLRSKSVSKSNMNLIARRFSHTWGGLVETRSPHGWAVASNINPWIRKCN